MSRKLVIIATVLVITGGLLVRYCPGATQTHPATAPALTAPPVSETPGAQKLSEIMRDSKARKGAEPLDDGVGVMFEMLGYVLVIVILGVIAIIVVKKVLPRIGVGVPSGKRISTLETVYLGPRKTVHLLQVGRRRILVGSSRDGISMLSDVSGAFDDEGEIPGDSND
ncbi:MAG: flagellar biosynthetic protein FliO [Planctomycetota bacterium]